MFTPVPAGMLCSLQITVKWHSDCVRRRAATRGARRAAPRDLIMHFMIISVAKMADSSDGIPVKNYCYKSFSVGL